MDNARRIAVQALQKCENSGYSNLVLSHFLETTSLSPRDKGFVSILVYGTIEKTALLDFILQAYISKPLKKLDAPVRAVLRSALYQCLFLESVPKSAAINEAVTLVKKLGKTSAAGLVNAVLRKAATTDIQKLEFATQLQRTTVIYCISESVAKLLIKHYPDNYEQILKYSQQKPQFAIRVNTLKISQDELVAAFEKENISVQKTQLENALFIDYKGDITKTKFFTQGLFHIQGLPSQLAAMAVCAKEGEKIIDVCSAPGGKAATIAQSMNNKGQMYACDLQQSRLSLIDSLFTRNGITMAKTMQWDACEYNSDFENADAVLCDVPCSGIGIISKKPDIRYKDLNDIETLIMVQKAILQTASKYVKNGGRLIYSTCTINPCENEQVVDEFLQTNKDFYLKKINLPFITENGYQTFLPKEGQSDGFFVAYLERL